ncbi:hypothetical protein XH92_15030 [Bradyrhizobium sp. CCBAU 53421]|nr:hypothetical protein XH92_15030 [Bradyrhizobium sp. CCBAU 53421]
MSFTVKARCKFGEIVYRRATPEAALRKAKELSGSCYDIHIVTPEGRDYASSEFGDLPRSPVARRPLYKTHSRQ